MRRFPLALLVALAGLSACGDDPLDGPEPTTTTTSIDATPASSTTEGTSDAPTEADSGDTTIPETPRESTTTVEGADPDVTTSLPPPLDPTDDNYPVVPPSPPVTYPSSGG